jgi:multisubunit Na+/H+ antiporter MnhF subunit
MREINILIACLIGVALTLMLYNLLIAKERLVKFISINVITSYVIVFIVLLVVSDNKLTSYLDIALIYALLSFIVSVAIMKYYREG